MARRDTHRLRLEAYLDALRSTRLVETYVGALMLKEGVVGITYPQATALLVLLQEREAITATRLAEHLSVSTVTVSRFVRALEAGGWIRRVVHAEDSRKLLLEPTVKAKRNVQRFLRITHQAMQVAYRGLTVSELRDLAGSLGKIRENVGRALEKLEPQD